MYLGVKHTLTNGGECKRWSPMTPKCIPTLGITFMGKSQMFKTLVEKANRHQIGPHDTIGNFFKRKCLKCTYIVH
jgi:hypothetical protein